MGDSGSLNTYFACEIHPSAEGTIKNYFSIFFFSFLFFKVPFVHLLPSHILRASDTNTHPNIFLDSWLFVKINPTQLIPLINPLFGSFHARISPQQFPKSSANFSLQYSHVSPAALHVDCWTVKAQVRKMGPCETMTRKPWL